MILIPAVKADRSPMYVQFGIPGLIAYSRRQWFTLREKGLGGNRRGKEEVTSVPTSAAFAAGHLGRVTVWRQYFSRYLTQTLQP